MLNSVCKYSQRQRLHFGYRVLCSGAVDEGTRYLRYFGYPSSVVFLLGLDCKG